MITARASKKSNRAEPVYCTRCKTEELTPGDWPLGGSGICRKCDEEEDAEAAKADRRLNSHGVYVRGLKTIDIQFAKSHGCKAIVSFIERAEKDWAYGFDCETRKPVFQGSSCPISRHSKRFESRSDCILAALNTVLEIARKNNWQSKAITTIEQHVAEVRSAADPKRNTTLSTTTPTGIATFDPDARPTPPARDKRPVAEWQITIDPEFAALLPALSTAERTKLRELLRAEGCSDPLKIWGAPEGHRELVDGHHRYEIARELDIVVPCVELRFYTRAAALAWIVKHQAARRNVPAATLDDLIARVHATTQPAPRGRPKKQPPPTKGHTATEKGVQPAPIKSRVAQTADALGVTPARVKRAVPAQKQKAAIAAAVPDAPAEAIQTLPRQTASALSKLPTETLKKAMKGDKRAMAKLADAAETPDPPAATKPTDHPCFDSANRAHAETLLATHLAKYPTKERYQQTDYLLDAINAWRGRNYVGRVRKEKPKPR